MKILFYFMSSLKAMNANKARTFLTVLGVVIGIASVIIVFSAGEGIKGLIVGQVESFGTDFIEVEIKVPTSKKGMAAESQSGASLLQGVQTTSLSLDDVEDIDRLSNITNSYAVVIGQEQVSYNGETQHSMIYGATASYIDIDKSEIDTGRFFTEGEDKSLAKVAVLGFETKKKLFGTSDAIGRMVKIKKSKYKVVGVLKERGAVMTLNFDEFVYLPVRTMQKRMLGIDHVLMTMHKVKDMSKAEETAREIRYILRENHDIDIPDDPTEVGQDDFRVVTMTEMMDMMGTITTSITFMLLAIVVISLVVGGVGIMNIMYVIVSERTSEIGLRKAVGANYDDIMLQFMVESVLITLIGGIVGILSGVFCSWAIAKGAVASGFSDWKFVIPIYAYFVAFGFSAFFGIVFGVYPARKAAQLDPIEALKAE